MLKKLKSVLETPRGLLLILALKAAFFGGLLFVIASESVIASGAKQSLLVILFFIVAFYFYFRSFFNTRQFLASFLVLITAAVLIMSLQGGVMSLRGEAEAISLSLFFSFLFFLLLGIKDLIFVRREPLYYLLNGLLLLTVFVYFFSFNNFEQPFWFLVKSLAAFLAIFFLFREFLFMSLRGEVEAISAPFGNKKINLMAAGSAFLSLQFLWVVAFLPFRSLNAASLALLIALILEDFIVHHLSGTINRRIILRNMTMFLILTMIIFGASRWTIN